MTESDKALYYINNTDKSIFLTGKAGTGKTTFLRNLAETCDKTYIVAAPTGIAAMNARGQTLHSLFQIPPEMYLPDVPEYLAAHKTDAFRSRFKMSDSKKSLLRNIELLVIDEISMVRADLLDAIDDTLKYIRRDQSPFGGVQVLMIGDVWQLPPVLTDKEAVYFKKVYKSPFFFSSHVFRDLLKSNNIVMIELNKVWRQTDDNFINILNKFREGRADFNTIDELNKRVDPKVSGSIVLCTHNSQADNLNRNEINKLIQEGRNYISSNAIISDDFPKTMYPLPDKMTIVEGERIMFVVNDPDHKFVNGTLGTVTRARKMDVLVKTDNGEEIPVSPYIWKNIKYWMDKKTGSIVSGEVGSFFQYPIKPAWAVTIHKSQGLTFDNVIIDGANAFAFGQIYVALSRCRTLEGLQLSSPLPYRRFEEPIVSKFIKYMKQISKNSHICDI